MTEGQQIRFMQEEKNIKIIWCLYVRLFLTLILLFLVRHTFLILFVPFFFLFVV